MDRVSMIAPARRVAPLRFDVGVQLKRVVRVVLGLYTRQSIVFRSSVCGADSVNFDFVHEVDVAARTTRAGPQRVPERPYPPSLGFIGLGRGIPSGDVEDVPRRSAATKGNVVGGDASIRTRHLEDRHHRQG